MTAEPLFLKEKQKYLNMSESEKRKTYKSNVTLLNQVKNWKDYFLENKDRLQEYLNDKISIWKGDITRLEIDAVVNAANSTLLGGGGVDGAIHRAAGKFLLEECKTLNGCDTGDAKITGGYMLPAKYVIHTVGPQGEKPELLKSCYKNCLKLLLENNLKSIAFPCISTGIYGYPQDSAAFIALKCIREFLESNSTKVEKIIFCLFLEKDVEIYEAMMQLFFPTS